MSLLTRRVHAASGPHLCRGGFFEFRGCTPGPPTSHGAPRAAMALNSP